MASRNLPEIIVGAAVLLVAGGFLVYAVANTGRGTVSGTRLTAKFDRIDGLAVGSDVRVAGVKVGTIAATGVDPRTFQATVTFTVQPSLRIPRDSSAEVTSDGLLGGKFVAVVPGGDDRTLVDGGEITITQSAASLEQLLGKFIFGVSDLTTAVQKQLKENDQNAPPTRR